MTLAAFALPQPDEFFHLEPHIDVLHFPVLAHEARQFSLQAGDCLQLACTVHQDIEILLMQAGQVIAAEQVLQSLPEQLSASSAIQSLAQLAEGGRSAQYLAQYLQQAKIQSEDLSHGYRASLSDDDHLVIVAATAVEVYVLNTGPRACVYTQEGREEIQVTLQPATPLTAYLPAPMATVVQEIHIPRASAKTYQVKAGEWIQIIDVSGKQCSDFLAFDQAALQRGEEVGLDAVATRSILGMATPSPGLHAKFFDAHLQPLVEVVQDTVGRHDMFLTACSAKFYQDAGYFGHVSCSDNFNQVLKPYGIAPRAAWPAINFFYNTEVLPCGTIGLNEPWSMPGDYVLLRAQRDLICASSACPDEIDASNGWMPTDIHVRIYAKEAVFPRSQPYRLHPWEMPRMTKSSGFSTRVQALTKQLIAYKGYWVANEYQGWGAQAEYLACRQRVAMIDLSALRKFDISGPDAESFLNKVITRNVRQMAIHEIVYSAMCQDTGGMIDDGTLFRLGAQNFRWICGDEYAGTWLRQQAQQGQFRVSIRHVSDHIHNVALQGPHSREVLQQALWTSEQQVSIEQLKWFHFTHAKLGGPEGIPLTVSRTGYTGELGFEIWCHPDHAEQLWDTLWQAGQAYGIAPLGFHALDMLRIEAGLIFAEHEFSPMINPFEAGIGFTTPLKSKTEDFIGRDALLSQSAQSRQKLMGLVFERHDPVAHGDQVYVGRYPVGIITSATYSPLLGKQIALCRLAPQYAVIDQDVEVGQLDGQRKRLKAKVVSIPFYDPERTRVRS